MADAWKDSLKRQLASRNTLQGTYFQELLRVHGATAADERQFRRRALRAEPAAAEAAPLREQHNAALLHKALFRRATALEHLDAVYRMAFHLARKADEAEDPNSPSNEMQQAYVHVHQLID